MYLFLPLSQYIMELTDGTGIGRICECSGVSQMVNTCFSYLRKGGRTVLIGLPKQPLHVENVLQDIGNYKINVFVLFFLDEVVQTLITI